MIKLPIETDRLIIKGTSKEDVELLLKMDKQEETQRYLGGIKNKTREERLDFLEKKENKLKEGLSFPLTVILKDGTKVGFIGLSEEGELSYIFDYDYCNNGYCTEACNRLIDIGFNELGFDIIFAESLEENKSSRRVLEKLGFKYIKTNDNFLYYEIKKE